MPPHSKTLSEEGAVFISFFLVRAGVFQEEAVSEVLVRSGTRALRDNVADLRAQVAANHKGATLLRELVAAYGLSGVTAYMEHIRANAERSVRALLRGAAQRWGAVLEAEDRMDDGSPICLRVTVQPEEVSCAVPHSAP
ncbi:5-oxoprolinase [Lagopus muta]|uniref:5-oxoprolinase n=1 Tax=Lagopus muta TaxID=64668 RepID=UPI0020A08199|nr:5-oxoprolinase [Lagopus muta]